MLINGPPRRREQVKVMTNVVKSACCVIGVESAPRRVRRMRWPRAFYRFVVLIGRSVVKQQVAFRPRRSRDEYVGGARQRREQLQTRLQAELGGGGQERNARPGNFTAVRYLLL